MTEQWNIMDVGQKGLMVWRSMLTEFGGPFGWSFRILLRTGFYGV